MTIEVANAVEAPYFQLGKTTEEDWIDHIGKRLAPWAELEVPGQISFVFPSYELERISNVTALMEYWSELMEAFNKFAGFDVILIL